MTELVHVLGMDKRPRADNHEVRKVGVFDINHLSRRFHLERRMRDPIAQGSAPQSLEHGSRTDSRRSVEPVPAAA